ncbi:hypothetical protein COW36_20685 [bacterium (Candidatus Blackallbacteria) CG17_big_fil_post_rev_8_21_14_2_50_48_46]|uniref:Uncharacterized protein n=1 Tax=bacterium (Candidatus Blackallbacteria) CG17_big_fil_post_rev_8_21_14_2_50_48_46 TaxID=2014261 RepID=A0A2M7FZU6_9BACT|nr:MAG: hypothetical protein COW64_13995 [bacterium (Candidatus Blackallbacteria) CG18_big_fil_WC_8_21_14_2_50_49_26]PIW14459.1 MAG: hypothetical protein COW36_20685 [bacterium (Candidatus Blackallbacteria) CG17_big_fil_post_rev_8_21_14_2_50_48_46]PIW47145.1 MAG: hypothetical protein COW20_13130 [bacterium (Candidatus Blackallbacteria) CG13_big_fil_rev_8_21_14_2_50_49_14]
MGPEALGAIQANYSGKEIVLTLTGFFPGVLSNTEVYLDNEISLELVSSSQTEIQARFNTRNIPDLYLVGNQHTLSVFLPSQTLKVQVRVGPPEQSQNLAPQILSVSVQRDSENQPENILIKGQNLMLNSLFAQVTLDGQILETFESGFEEQDTRLLLGLPEDGDFSPGMSHRLSYISPFGISIYEFKS